MARKPKRAAAEKKNAPPDKRRSPSYENLAGMVFWSCSAVLSVLYIILHGDIVQTFFAWAEAMLWAVVFGA
jgi:hypothetical protein